MDIVHCTININDDYHNHYQSPSVILLLVLDHLLKSLSNHFHCDKLKFHLHWDFLQSKLCSCQRGLLQLSRNIIVININLIKMTWSPSLKSWWWSMLSWSWSMSSLSRPVFSVESCQSHQGCLYLRTKGKLLRAEQNYDHWLRAKISDTLMVMMWKPWCQFCEPLLDHQRTSSVQPPHAWRSGMRCWKRWDVT